MLYHASLSFLSAPHLLDERNAVNQRFQKDGNDLDRIKLIVLLSLPDTPFHNTTAARDLLKSWPPECTLVENAISSARCDFARFLDMLLTGQQRAETAAADRAQALAAEKARSKSLQGKIDAIKEMEINPARREQP